MAAELDGPRLAPKNGPARQLVVFLHGYGADGNDLIEIGRAWQRLLPDAAFVAPHASRPCGQAPMGREWFPLFLGELLVYLDDRRSNAKKGAISQITQGCDGLIFSRRQNCRIRIEWVPGNIKPE